MTSCAALPPAPEAMTSGDFPVHWPVLTRWADNDMFGHLNNAVYYQLFDTAINGWIAANAPDVDPIAMPELGVVAESGCRFLGELGFPDRLLVGFAVTRLGRSSVTYRLGVFRAAEHDAAAPGGDAVGAAGLPVAALGHWVHVYVDRGTRRPVPIPARVRAVLATAQV